MQPNLFNDELKISKAWAMPNSRTFQIKPIGEFVKKYLPKQGVTVDPFANDCKFGTITNDLNPEFDTDFHLDALEFLKLQPDESADCVIYDPPYSRRQISECYKGVGIATTTETTQSSWNARQLDEITRILKWGGILLSFGWNTNGGGKKRGFKQVEILIVSHGGGHNDTLCVAERKGD